MGLYDDRLANLSEPRLNRRVARRDLQPPVRRGAQPVRSGVERAYPRSPAPSFSKLSLGRQLGRPAPARLTAPPVSEAARRRPSMDVQSLLFSRDGGWTPIKAKAWAQSHGYKYGKVDTTGQYVRIRQFDPQGLKVKRTIPFGRGIRAVVAREGVNSMATTQEARRRRPRRTREEAPKRRRVARAATSTTVAASRRPKRRKVRAVAAPAKAAEASRRRKKPARRKKARRATEMRKRSSHVMEASRRRRPKRRRARAEAWRGDKAGHRKAALKGIRRRKAKRRSTRESVMEASRRRSPKRRRVRSNYTMEAKSRRRSSRRMSEARRGGSDMGARAGQLALAVGFGGLGFVLADGLDRMLATYDPTVAEKPKDKFTSDGAGTLANTLNVASSPGLMRVGVGLGSAVIPAVAAMYVKHPFVRSSLEGVAIGAGVSLFKMLWNNFLMPALGPKKDADQKAIQGSYIARLYPAEVAAAINLASKRDSAGKLPEGPYSATGVLSGPAAAETGVSAPADVGPFALATPGDDFPTLQNVWGTGEYPTAAQALQQQAGTADEFGVEAFFPGIATAVRRAAVRAAGGPLTPAQKREVYQDVMQCMKVGLRDEEAGVSAPPSGAVDAPAQAGVAAWDPGPASVPGPGPGLPPGVGPQPPDTSCGCIGDDNPYLGFVGDEDVEGAPLMT